MQIVKSPLYPPTALSRKGSTSLMTLIRSLISFMGLPRWHSDKESTYQCRRCRFNPWVGKIPWKRKWQPIPVFLPGKIPRTEKPGGLQNTGSQKVGQDLATEHYFQSRGFHPHYLPKVPPNTITSQYHHLVGFQHRCFGKTQTFSS